MVSCLAISGQLMRCSDSLKNQPVREIALQPHSSADGKGLRRIFMISKINLVLFF